MIDILIPVLGRPQNAGPLVQNIHDTTSSDYRIFFVCSRGDTAQIQACSEIGGPVHVIVAQFPAGHADYARKINGAFKGADSEWVFQGADDIRFEPGWDTAALKAAGNDIGVVATNDLANSSVKRGQFGTHNLIRRRYVTDRTGLVLHEGYDHNFVDRELCGWAQSDDTYVFARHSHVRHYHPLWKTALNDATYNKSLAHFREDQQLFLSRAHLWDYHGLSAHERKLAA